MKIQDIKYIDCHSHPHDIKYKNENIDVESFLIDLKNDGGGTIAIGTDYKLSLEAIELANKHENAWATIGVHPADNHAEEWNEENFQNLINKDKEKSEKNGIRKIVAVGECGLDYFYFAKTFGEKWKESKEEKVKVDEEIRRQKILFINQINFAIKNNLPLVIHGRPSKGSMNAYEDILDILETEKEKLLSKGGGEAAALKGHAHFFVGDLNIAKRFLDLGFLLSFDGPTTFTNEYDEVIKHTPIENIIHNVCFKA
jgi:TatD DNase family protein